MPSCFSSLLPARRGTVSPQSQDSHRRESLSSSALPVEKPTAYPACAHCTQDPYLLPAYESAASLGQATPFSDPMNKISSTISLHIQSLDSELREFSLKMHARPEVAWEERKTHDLFIDFFKEKHKEWNVTPHFGMETAFKMEFEHLPKGYRMKKGEKLPTIGFNSELDALPGIGHACGHNLIAIGGIAASLAVAAALVKHDIPGKVILLGTPAEEVGGGKINLLDKGAYKDMDACAMIHPAPLSTIGSMLAVVTLEVTYTGRTSHAGAAPFEGINAQDAAVLAYNNIAVLRQQLEPTTRTHGIIQGQNWAANVIPGKSKVLWMIRSTDIKKLKDVRDRVRNCFEAAGLATGCKVEIDEKPAYADLRNQASMAADYAQYMKEEYDETYATDSWAASTDFGNVTYALPAIHPIYAIPVKDPKTEGNHTVGFTAAAKTPEAHKLTLKAAEGIAIIGARVVVEGEYRERVRKEWEEWKSKQ